MPVVMDMDGNENNELEVKKGKSDSGSQDSLDSWEKVDIPSEEELERHSRSMFKAQASTLQLTLEAELPPPPSTSEVTSTTALESNNSKPFLSDENITCMNSFSKEESISVVERVFNMEHATTLEALKSNGAELLEEEEFEDEYWDTEDFKLTRRGLWLRLRRQEGQGNENWQLRKLDQQSKLKLVTDEKAIAIRLNEELGIGGEGVFEVMEVLLSNGFKKMLAFNGGSSKWRLGVVEIEMRMENKMDTATLRVVGEVMAALQELHANAEMLHLKPLNVKTIGGGGGVGSGAA